MTEQPCNQSEVARLMAQIDLEFEAGKRAMYGLALGTSQHAVITARMERMIGYMHELERVGGKETFHHFLLHWGEGEFLENLSYLKALAQALASKPERFTLLAFDLEVREGDNNYLIFYDCGEWSCSCDFFKVKGSCIHTMASQLWLQELERKARESCTSIK